MITLFRALSAMVSILSAMTALFIFALKVSLNENINYQEITSGINSTLADIVRSLMIILSVF